LVAVSIPPRLPRIRPLPRCCKNEKSHENTDKEGGIDDMKVT